MWRHHTSNDTVTKYRRHNYIPAEEDNFYLQSPVSLFPSPPPLRSRRYITSSTITPTATTTTSISTSVVSSTAFLAFHHRQRRDTNSGLNARRHQWNSPPTILPLKLPAHSMSYANESQSFLCNVGGSPKPKVQWFVKINQTIGFVPVISEMSSLGFIEEGAQLKFKPIDISAKGNKKYSFFFYCQATNLLGTARSITMLVERVVPHTKLKVEYETKPIKPGLRARVTCKITQDSGYYFVINHWILSMDGIDKKIDHSSDKYRYITEAVIPELHILDVTTEELDRLYVRCVFKSRVNQGIPELDHNTQNPKGFQLKREIGDVDSYLHRDFIRLRVPRGERVEFPCYSLQLDGYISWFFKATHDTSGSQYGSKIDLTKNNNRFSMIPSTGGNLVINSIDIPESGTYTCKSTKVASDVVISVEVSEPFRVNLEPSVNKVNERDSSELACVADGKQGVIQMYWLFNGQPLRTNVPAGVELKDIIKDGVSITQKLYIHNVSVEHVGSYQCFIHFNDTTDKPMSYDNAVGTAVITIEKMAPQLKEQDPKPEESSSSSSSSSSSADYRTARVFLSLNSHVSESSTILKCQFYGYPIPNIEWLRDDEKIQLGKSVLFPQIDKVNDEPIDSTPAMAYVEKASLRIDIAKANGNDHIWEYGGEYRAVAIDQTTNKTAECRTMVHIDTKLRIRSMKATLVCTAGTLCKLKCYAIGVNKVTLEWHRKVEGQLERVPVDHRQSVLDEGRTVLIRDVDDQHKGIYECTAIIGSEKVQASTELIVAWAPKVTNIPSAIQVTEGQNTITTLCNSMVQAEKPWFAWWQFHPANNINDVRYLCNQDDSLKGAKISYVESAETNFPPQEWMKSLPCYRETGLKYVNQVPTLHIAQPQWSLHNGNFTCVIKNVIGRDSQSFKVTFTPEYTFAVRPPNKLEVILGQSTNINCSAKRDDNTPPAVVWRFTKKPNQNAYNDVPYADVDLTSSNYIQYRNGTLSLRHVTADIPTNYYCFILPQNSQIKSKSTAVNVDIKIPASIKALPDPKEVRKNSSFNLTCDVTGDLMDMSVTWNVLEKSETPGVSRQTFIPVSSLCDFDSSNKKSHSDEINNRAFVSNNNCLSPDKISNYNKGASFKQFFVYKKSNDGIENHLQIEGVSELETNDYKCIAKNRYNNIDEPATMQLRLKVISQPGPVTIHMGPSISSRQVNLSWSPPIVDGGKEIKYYMVSYRTSTNKTLTIQNVTKLEANLVNLKPFRDYNITVAAVNDVGIGEYKSLIVHTKADKPDGGVVDLKANGTSSDVISVHWKSPNEDTTNGKIEKYVLCYLKLIDTSSISPLHQLTWPNIDNFNNDAVNTHGFLLNGCVLLNEATLNYEITNLPKFTAFAVRITAFNQIGASPHQYTSARTLEDLPQEPPEHVKCSSSIDNLSVSWAPPKQATINGVLTGYVITYFPSNEYGDESGRRQDNVSKSTQTKIIGLYPYTNYTIQVRALNSKGVGPASTPVICATNQGKPSPVREIRAGSVNESCIGIGWLPPERPNGPIRLYCILIKSQRQLSVIVAQPLHCQAPKPRKQQSAIICKLEAGVNYNVSVYAQSTVTGPETAYYKPVSPSHQSKDVILSAGDSVNVLNNADLILDCVTAHSMQTIPYSKPHWTLPFTRPTSTANTSLVVKNINRDQAGRYSCSIEDDTIYYDVTVLQILKEPPKPPIWQQATTSNNGIQIAWFSQGTTRADVPIIGFELQWHNVNHPQEKNTIYLDKSARNYYLNPLPCATGVKFLIRANNSIGFSSWSDAVVYNTTGRAPLLSEGAASAFTKGDTWAYFNLTKAFPPGDGCWPELYYLTISPTKEGKLLFKQDNLIYNESKSRLHLERQCCWNVTNLNIRSEYAFLITAINSAGNATVKGQFTTTILTAITPDVTPIPGADKLSLFAQPMFILPIAFVILCIIIVIIGFILYLKRRDLIDRKRKTQTKKNDLGGGVGSPMGHPGAPWPASASNKPLPPRPQMSEPTSVYSRGNSNDLPRTYPAYSANRRPDDSGSIISYNSENDINNALNEEIQPYAVYERNGVIRIDGDEFIAANDPMTTSIISTSDGRFHRQKSSRSGRHPTMTNQRQFSQPVGNMMSASTHHGGPGGGGSYHYPQQQHPGMIIGAGTMRPQGRGGHPMQRHDEEAFAAGRKSSSLDCIHQAVPEPNESNHVMNRNALLLAEPTNSRYHVGYARGASSNQPQQQQQQIQPPPAHSRLAMNMQMALPATTNMEPVYRGGTSTVSSNHDELAQAYEAGNFLTNVGGVGGVAALRQQQQQQQQHQQQQQQQQQQRPSLAAPMPMMNSAGNDSSGSSTDPGIREFTQQPPRPAETRQAVCQIAPPAQAIVPMDGRGRSMIPPSQGGGHRAYQRGISDMTDAYDTIESTSYYPVVPPSHHQQQQQQQQQRMPDRRRPSHGTMLQAAQKQPLLSPNEEWADAAYDYNTYYRGGPSGGGPVPISNPVNANPNASNSGKIHPITLAAARGETRYMPQQSLPAERRPLLSSSVVPPNISAAGGAGPSHQWSHPGVGVGGSGGGGGGVPISQDPTGPGGAGVVRRVSDEDEEEEDPYTDKFTVV